MIYLPIHLGLVYGKCRYCKYAMDPMGNMKFTGPESIPQVHLSNRLHAELLCGHLFRNIGGLGESQVAFKGLGSTPSCHFGKIIHLDSKNTRKIRCFFEFVMQKFMIY